MGVFIVIFYKRIGGPCKNEVLWRKRLQLCEKDSDFVSICGMNVCKLIRIEFYMLKSGIYNTTSTYKIKHWHIFKYLANMEYKLSMCTKRYIVWIRNVAV